MENFLADKVVVIIDDDPLCDAVLAEFLGYAGAKVIQTNSGEEGLDLVDQHEVTLIICGLNLLDIPAVPLIRQLHELTIQTPIIALTDTHDVNLIAAVMRAGVYDVILKPLTDVSALKALILEAVYPDMFTSSVDESDKLQEEWNHLMTYPEESFALLRNLQPPAHLKVAGCHVGYRQLNTSENNGLIIDIAELSEHEFGFYIFDAEWVGEYGAVAALLLRAFFNDLLKQQIAAQPDKLPALNSVLHDIQQLLKKSGLQAEYPLVIGYYNRLREHLLIVNNGLSCVIHHGQQHTLINKDNALGRYYHDISEEQRLVLNSGECEVWNGPRKLWLRFH
ncbi:response regulator [Rosenbergiella australiborealis]|uniref:Response regulator n=1 Tax=Rosenbergiella australiborealis TaxID=1544696 RepID=A0ABS5T1W9_9GAMM|nr:response regulator [Rosenbergiella australiborealis]